MDASGTDTIASAVRDPPRTTLGIGVQKSTETERATNATERR